MSPDMAHVKNWIFDLDNTLYRGDADFFSQIDRKITEFIARYLSLDPQAARHLQKKYLADYGTSLSGMMAVHDMDPIEYLEYVHDVELDMLKPDPMLRAYISALPGRKFIYTNGSKGHAKNVATHLNLFDLFDGSFGVEDADYQPKPKRTGYDIFNSQYDIDPKTAIFFEDNLRNLEVPKQMGMVTVLVTSDADFSDEPEITRPAGSTTHADWIDYVTHDITAFLGEMT